jgi:hypothetical protein
MLGHRYIIAAAVAGSLSNAAFASSKPLSKSERVVCQSLRDCADILKRHDASEFDYGVLKREFERFGVSGRNALFDILESDAGNPDIAGMILSLGPLSPAETERLNRMWFLQIAAQFLPLLKNTPEARDKILLTLGHADPNVREAARQAMMSWPDDAFTAPPGNDIVEPLLRALINDPMAIAASFVERANVGVHTDLFSTLLLSGDVDLVVAAYNALYRDNPKQAFQHLLSEMRRLESPEQARAIGDMLAERHAQRNDGFYLKFAQDILADRSFPIPARAAGLHAVLRSHDSKAILAIPRGSETFAFLLRQQNFIAQDIYMPALTLAGQSEAIADVVEIAQSEKWINRDQITQSLKGTPFYDAAVRDLIRSDDIRSVRAGLKFALPRHTSDIRSQIDHPVSEISSAAKRRLKLPIRDPQSQRPCRLAPYDMDRVTEQMPFFDSAWFRTQNGARISATRDALISAHPASRGWLAGYDLSKLPTNTSVTGGGLVFFDNKTGVSRHIGDFISPIAVLPDRHLNLGQTTSRFWVVDSWGGDSDDTSLYRLDMSNRSETVKHIGILPHDAKSFSVAPNGDFLVTFLNLDKSAGLKQPPLRYSAKGTVSHACTPSLAPRSSQSLN